jgi:carbon-monoxide dehydrogenase medium subunit
VSAGSTRLRVEYFEPNFLGEALVLVERFAPDARLLAGGTRLGPILRAQPEEVYALVNLKRIVDLKGVTVHSSHLHIAPLVTAAELAQDGAVRSHAPALAAAAAAMGACQLRCLATVGGNVCSVDGSSDLTTALLACDAYLEFLSPAGSAVMTLEQYLARELPQPGPCEILTDLRIPLRERRGAYLRFTIRHAFERAILCVACSLDPSDPRQSLRIAVGGVGAVPVRARIAEEFLFERTPNAETCRLAAEIAADALAPPADERAGAHYRRHLAAILIRRALEMVLRGEHHA